MMLQDAGNNPEQALAFYASWASILSLVISVVSLILIRSVRANIIRFRRKERLLKLIEEVSSIRPDAIPLGAAAKSKLSALKRNIPTTIFWPLRKKWRVAKEVHKHIDACMIHNKRAEENLDALKEVIADWGSFTDDK